MSKIIKGKTASGLVAYCKKALGRQYLYGTFGNIATKNLYYTKKRQYPEYYNWPISEVQLGKPVFDCVGLIKGYLWSSEYGATPKYKKAQDVSANGMLSVCDTHGPIKSIPDKAGVLVFKSGHVGVYIGDGYVIEARGHAYGVVKTKLSERGWVNWGFCPFIEYDTKTVTKTDKKTENAKKRVQYYPKYKGGSISIVDALSAIGVKDVSLKARKAIANKNGIKGYTGRASQNLKLLKLLKHGKLKK